MRDLITSVEVTNGGGPKFTIPMGLVVLAIAVLTVLNQFQVRENGKTVAGLVLLQKEDTKRIRLVEDAVLELKATRDLDNEARGKR